MAHNPMGTDPSDSENHAIFNAATQTRNVVDPRTGLFEVYVKLPSITGNNGNGPAMDMSLFYSPLVNNRAALGDGWSFALTTYNKAHSQLRLHTGEKLNVGTQGISQPAVSAEWQSSELYVRRKDGRLEILKEVGLTGIFLPTSLTTDGYNSVTFNWTTTEHEIEGVTHYQIQLTAINDAIRQLFKAEYVSVPDDEESAITSATLTFWPDDTSETLSYELQMQDYALQSVTLANDIETTFDYQDHPTCGWLLTLVDTFDGLHEQVVYQDNGLQFPGNPKLSALPCVSTHTLTPSGGGTPVITGYTYQRQDPTHYTTTMSEGNPAIRSTTYNYNENHELTLQVLTQGTATTSTAFTASSQDDKLNYSTSVTYSQNAQSRTAAVKNTYDEYSAIVENAQDGAITEWDYLRRPILGTSRGELRLIGLLVGSVIGIPSVIPLILYKLTQALSGSDALRPARFNSRYLTTEFVEKDKVSVPTRFSYNAYKDIPQMSEARLAGTLQWLAGTGSVLQAALVGREITYFEDIDFRLGRQKTITLSSRDARTFFVTSRDPVLSFDYTLGGTCNTELTTRTTETDEAANQRTSSQTQSILSGRLIRQVDADGNRTEYTYDSDGRLNTLTTCAQSPAYKQVTRYAYPAPGHVMITEPNGQMRRWETDGRDNLIKEYLITDEEYLVKEISFDSIGRELRTTQYDYPSDGSAINEWYESKYDDWNAISSRKHSDGHEDFNQYDPVTMKRTEWSGTATDRHGKVTTYNLDETVSKVEWKGLNGNTFKTQVFTYHPAKLVKQLKTTGEYGVETVNYDYDAAGRLVKESHIEKDLGSIVTTLAYTYHYTYPAHWLANEAERVEIQIGTVRRTLGSRTFDSAWRVTSLTRGSVTERYNYNGARQVPESVTHADGVLHYEYIKELGNRPGKIRATTTGEEKTFTYSYGNQPVSSASEGEHFLQYTHDLNSLLTKQRVQTATGQAREILTDYSLGGHLLNETDAEGNQTTLRYVSKGQRSVSFNADLTTNYFYDDLGHLAGETVAQAFHNPTEQVTLDVGRTYDAQGRETSRHFRLPSFLDLKLESTYYSDGNLKLAQLKKDQAIIGSRSLTYTAGNRLKSCTTTGVSRPKNPAGKAIDRQDFTYDAMGNVITCMTTFGTAKNTSTYTYDASNAYRLTRIQNNHADYPQSANLSYDASGRVTQDQTGKKYTYDWLGRLTQAGSTYYDYDPSDRLMTRTQSGETGQIIYEGREVRGEYGTGPLATTRHLSAGSTACTVQHITRSGIERTLFELRDLNGTVVASYDWKAQTTRYHAYTAFGEHFSDEADSLLGFNGEYRDVINDQYPLGQGYRWYAPNAKQFHVPDTLSPFQEGGPHPYGYCTEGDPVNYQDPSGHFNVSTQLRKVWGDNLPGPVSLGNDGSLVATVLWTGVGVLTAVMTGGTSLLLTASLVGLAAASSTTAIVSVIIADTQPELSQILGWVSLGLGVFGGAATLLKKVTQLATYLARSGSVIARSLYTKAAAASTTTFRRLGLYKDYSALYGKFAPLPSARLVEPFPYNANTLLLPKGATALFDVGDINTITFVTTGVFGLVGYMESDESQLINSGTGDATWLPWGNFSGLWLRTRAG